MRKGNNRGMTMVEVLAGFVILGLVLGGLTHVIGFSNRLLMKSRDMMDAQQSMKAEVYKTVPEAGVASQVTGVSFYLIDQNTGAYINLPQAKVYCYEIEDFGLPIFRFFE